MLVDFILVVVFGVMYFLPTYLAKVNHQSNFTVIAIFNTLLGWTIIGWALSFLWAMEEDRAKV